MPYSADCMIIMPVYNGLSHLRDCLDSVLEYTPHHNCQLLIIDDASDATTAAYLSRQASNHYDWITLQRNSENLGFLASCNRAMDQGNSPYILLLNSDVLVSPRWLERLLACAESNPNIASVNPLSNHADNIDLPMAPGVSYLAMNEYLSKQRQGKYHDVVTGVGFCMLLRRSALKQVGLFDPVYGRGYCEESDLCMRLTTAGFRTVVAEDVYIYHRGGGSFTDRNARYLRNRQLFDRRWIHEYRRQYRAFRRADPLRPTRRLFASATRWNPQPPAWQAARELLVEWRGRRSLKRLARITARHLPEILSSTRPHPNRDLIEVLTPPKRLRVTYVLDRLVVAGGVFSILQLVNELIRLGIEARIAALYEDPLIYDWYRLYTRPLIYRNATELTCELPDSDLVFATHWNTAHWVHTLWQNQRTRAVSYLIQDYEPWFFPESDILQRQRVKMTYPLIPNRIVMSDWLGNRLANDGYDSHKIPLGMDLGQFYPRPIRHENQPLMVLAMARPGTPRRGFPDTIKALAQVKRARPETEIVLFGDRFLGQHNIPFPFRDEGIVTRQEHLAKLYSAATVFLDGSEFQGFGRCALEAMACGAACVLTDCGGVLEYARHNENALLAPPHRPEQMADKIIRLLDDKELRQYLITNALDTAAQFCHRREAQDTLSWIKQTIDRSPQTT